MPENESREDTMNDAAHVPAQIDHYISGTTTPGSSSARADIRDPATAKVIGRVALGGIEDVDAAVRAAEAAYPEWSVMPPHVRARVLFRFRALVERDMDRLAAIITSEHGKTLSDARGEITRGLEVVEFACGVPELMKGDFSEYVARSVDAVAFRQPLGVVAGISPFNFPAMVPMWMFPIALATGNTFVMKPSEKDPTLCLELAKLLTEAGLPDGAFNVVNGGRTVGEALIAHDSITAVSFVGSTPIAEHVHREASARGKRVQALGGAKNHLVVMPDADLDGAVAAIMGAAYGSAGERCMAISVVVPVGEHTAKALREKLVAALQTLTVASGTADGADMGPLISREHLAKVSGYLDIGTLEGAELVVDGRRSEVPSDGYFIGGSLFDHVTPEMRVYREEIFGPILSMVRADSLSEAIGLINNHEFGNGAALFTGDGRAAREFTARVQVGMVGINVPIPVPMAFHSFGGWKRSLFGDHHVHGREGVRFYTRYKTAAVRWPETREHGADFSMPIHS